MSPADAAPSPESSAVGGPGASDVPVAGVVEPTAVRRAPRYRAFVGVGVLVGLLAGWVLAVLVSDVEVNRGAAIAMTMLAGGSLGALLAGAAAVLADRRSLRADRRPRRHDSPVPGSDRRA